MKYTHPKTIQEIIERISSIRNDVLNGTLQSQDGAGNVISMTYGNNALDIDLYISKSSDLEMLIELCADLEIDSDDSARENLQRDWDNIGALIERLNVRFSEKD